MLRRVPDMKVHGRGRSVVIQTPQHDRRARFRAVYDDNYHRVLGYLLRRTASREDAEDFLAETFLTVWRRQYHPPTRDRGCTAWHAMRSPTTVAANGAAGGLLAVSPRRPRRRTGPMQKVTSRGWPQRSHGCARRTASCGASWRSASSASIVLCFIPRKVL